MGEGTRLTVRLHGVLVPLKYGLAGGLAAVAGARWVPQDVISAAFVALLCCRPAVTSALREGRDQVLATALGVGITVAVMLVVGPGALALAVGAAATWAVAGVLRWPYPTVVVALFSVVYMGVLSQASWTDTALVRAGSLLLGVAAALVVNVLTAPLMARANVTVRLGAARSQVRELLVALAGATRLADVPRLDAAREGFAGLYLSLGEIQVELADLRQDSRVVRELVKRPGNGGRERAGQAAYDLELVAHHTQDAASAVREILAAPVPLPPEDETLIEEAARAFADAAAALASAGDGHGQVAVATAQVAARRVRERDAALEPPAEVSRRLGPRLALLVALAALLDHTARAAGALAGLGAASGEVS